jgi:abortive infection phage resistance protein abiU
MNNYTVLVDQFLERFQSNRIKRLEKSVAFEHFTLSLILKSQNLDEDEISEGRIGGSQDGGIDGVFTFLDEELQNENSDVLKDDFPIENIRRKKSDLDLWIVQTKLAKTFKEDVFDKIRASTEKLLQITYNSDEVNYSKDLISHFQIFTRIWSKIAIRMPNIKINMVYATRGDTTEVSDGVRQKEKDLKRHLEELVPDATVNIQLMGARELWERASATPEDDLQLHFQDYVSQDESYTGLVSLPDYFSFLSDKNGGLRGALFESNVRDCLRNVTVNEQIMKTLETKDSNDFWWFNNGVTILCTDVNISGDKNFTLSGAQIVNGMQTSNSIHKALSIEEYRIINEKRTLQVKIIKSTDEETRDRIIRATNSQTKVSDASLRATDEIQRQIEDYFINNAWFYERRKNFYKNRGKPSDRIVSISMLAQAVMAIGLSKPDVARARPSSLLKKDEDYKAIFNSKFNLATYLWMAKIQRSVNEMLINCKKVPEATLRTNLRFYISNFLVTRELGQKVRTPHQLDQLVEKDFTIEDADFMLALKVVSQELEKFSKSPRQLDSASKSHQFADVIVKKALEKA